MAFGGLNIGDLLLTLLADGSMLQKDITQQGLAAANAAGPAIGTSLGTAIATGLTRGGKQMSTIGKSMTTNLTVPIIAAGAAISMVGIQFDTALRKIVALTDVTAAEIGMVKAAILELAPAVGKSPEELAEAFYFLASSGFNAKEALLVLDSSARAAASGLGETQDVAKVISASINAFGKENLTAVDATDALIRAIKDGTAEAPDFAGALGDVVGSAGLVGATFQDTTAALAAMTLQGISADEAATSLNMMFRSLYKTTPIAAKGFAAVGLTVEGLRKQLKDEGLLPVLKTLEAAFAGNEVAAGKAFGEVRALRGVLALIGGDNLETSIRIFEDVANGTTNLATAFEESAGPQRRWNQSMARLQVMLIQLSDDVLPLVLDVMDEGVKILGSIADAFKSLPGPVRESIVKILALTAALGPLLFISGKVVGGIGGIVGAISKVAKSRIGSALFGPIINAATGLASKIAGPIISGLETVYLKALGNPAIGGAVGKLGTFMGSTLGKLGAVAFAAVMWYEVIETYNRIKGELASQNAAIDATLAAQLGTDTEEGLAAKKAALEKGLADINGVWDAGIFTTDTRRSLEANMAAVDAEIARRAAGFGPTVAAGIESGMPAVEGAYGQLFGPPAPQAQMNAAMRAAGKMIPQSMADGIISAQNAPVVEMAGLVAMMKHALTSGARIARDIGILTSKELAKGLKDKRPVVKAEALRVRDVVEKDLAELILAGGKVGKKAGAELAKKLKSKSPAVRSAAKRVKAIVDKELEKTVPSAGAAGAAAGAAFAARLRQAVLNSRIHGFTITANIGLRQGKLKGDKKARGGPVRAGMPYFVNEQTQRSEVMVPSVSGYVLTRAQAEAAMRGGGGSGDINIEGGIHLHGVGSDVTLGAQRRFAQGVLDDVAMGLREQRARRAG